MSFLISKREIIIGLVLEGDWKDQVSRDTGNIRTGTVYIQSLFLNFSVPGAAAPGPGRPHGAAACCRSGLWPGLCSSQQWACGCVGLAWTCHILFHLSRKSGVLFKVSCSANAIFKKSLECSDCPMKAFLCPSLSRCRGHTWAPDSGLVTPDSCSGLQTPVFAQACCGEHTEKGLNTERSLLMLWRRLGCTEVLSWDFPLFPVSPTSICPPPSSSCPKPACPRMEADQ